MKRFIIILICLLWISMIPITAFGDDEYDNYLKSFDLSAFENVPDDVSDILEELGISDFNYESITSLSPNLIINHIFSVISKHADGPLKTGIMIICFIIIASFFRSFSNELYQNNAAYYSTITTLIISVFIVMRISESIAVCCSTIQLCSDFAFAFFPAFCTIIATSGNIVTSISVNTMLLSLAQGLNALSTIVFMPATNCFLSISICSSLRQELNLNGIITFMKKIITMGISITASVFVSILSIKTAVSSGSDMLGLRSIRFTINTVVPIIGGSISEGLLSIQSYSGLIKTSVGVVGIIAVALIFLPALAEVLIWRFVLFLSSLCAGLFDDDSSVKTINCFSDMFLIINVILILSMVTTIISIGILIAAKTGA